MKISGKTVFLSPLELFILCTLDDEVATPYSLLSHYGLSVGATSPALKRLQKGGLVEVKEPKGSKSAESSKRSKSSKSKGRPRLVYAVTKDGVFELYLGVERYLRQLLIPPDLDSVVKICTVGLLVEDIGRGGVVAYLKKAAADRMGTAKSNELRAERMVRMEGPEALESYGWMKSTGEAQVARAEAKAFQDIATALSEPKESSQGVI